MTPKATRPLLQSMLCLLLSFICQAQQLTSKVKAPSTKSTVTLATQRINDEKAFRDSLYLLMESPPFEHTVLRQIEQHRTEHLALFSNPVEDALVVACAIDKKSLVAFFFTTFGAVSDFVLLDPSTYKAVVEAKTANVFELYTRYVTRNIEQINKAADDLRCLGINASKRPRGSPYLHLGIVEEAKTPLEKLLVLDICREVQIKKWASIRQKIICFDAADSVEKSLHSPAYQPGTCHTIGVADSTRSEYFNKNPFCPVERAVIVPAKAMVFLYDQKHGDQPIDSFAVKKEKVQELLAFKTNPFVLYRGYLEWQVQKVRDHLSEIEKQQKAKSNTNSPVQRASLNNQEEQYRKWQQAILWEHHCVRNINYLMLPSKEMMAVQKSMEGSRRWDKSRREWMPRQEIHTFVRGEKRYELTDHRGNVMAVISDRKTAADNNKDGNVEYYEPEVISGLDYNPYGAPLPGRSTHSKENYRYGYNGKENDSEIKGEGNQQDYGMRIYDPRLGRFLSVDPLQDKFPWFTPYQYAGNSPNANVDLDGLENANYNFVLSKNSSGKPCLAIQYINTEEPDFLDKVANAIMGIKEGQPTHAVLHYQGKQIAVFSSFQEMKEVVHGRSVEQIKSWESKRVNEIYKDIVLAHVAESSQATITAVVRAKIAASTSVTGAVEARVVAARSKVIYNRVQPAPTAGKTTTLIGSLPDIKEVTKNLSNIKSGMNEGGYNVLNVHKKYYTLEGNLKWLKRAIDRGDIIKAVSNPLDVKAIWKNGIVGVERTMFGEEVKFLEQNKYKYDARNQVFCKQ